MTPVSSMTLTATSSVMSPTMSGPAKPAPGPFGPNPSDVMAPYAAALQAPLTGASSNHPRFKINTAGVGAKNKMHRRHRVSSPVDIETQSSGNEGSKHGTDVLAHDEVRHVIEFRRVAIDNRQLRAVALGHEGKSGRRPHHEGRSDRQEQVAGRRQVFGAAHGGFRHGLAERDGRRLYISAAAAVGRATARLRQALAHPGQVVALGAVETG